MMDTVMQGVIGAILALQLFNTGYLIKHSERIKRIENDLYLDPRNPADKPFSLQLTELCRDIKSIKKEIESIKKQITGEENDKPTL